MANILVFAEQRQGSLKSYGLEAVSEGRRLADASSGKLSVCLIGSGVAGLATQVTEHGADKVLLADMNEFAQYQPMAYLSALQAAVAESNPEIILMSSSAMGKELGALLAASLDASLVSEITSASWSSDHLEVVRPIYAGKAHLKLAIRKTPSVVTLRPNVFPAAPAAGAGDSITLAVDLSTGSASVTITNTEVKDSTRPELTEASVIVSGGRGMGGPENYPVIEALADTLGAAVGASRAAVDAGWRPHTDQVGQTGKTVSPNLYIACGISGAIQHLAGMSSSKTIVAINTDPEAPIFKVADYGIVGDLFQVVPALDAAVKELLG